MTVDDFRQSLTAAEPPAELTPALTGLWWDAKGDWTRAHESAQQDDGPEGSWVYAYLHRKEGDQDSAGYWYGRAWTPVCREPPDTEWLAIVKECWDRSELTILVIAEPCRPFENVDPISAHTLHATGSTLRQEIDF
jgi:hypothetical protein